MNNDKIGRLILRATINGCGIPLDNVKIEIGDNRFITPQNNDGFSLPISLFISDKKGVCKSFTVKASKKGFENTILKNLPVTSGYTSIWSIPMSPKSKTKK